MIAFNRDFRRSIEAEVTVPGWDGIAFDLKSLEPITSYEEQENFRFLLRLNPGDGTMVFVGEAQDFWAIRDTLPPLHTE